MAMTPLPAAPQRTDPANFTTKADAFVAALPTFVTEANALETNVNTKEASTVSASAVALAAANYKGAWSAQVGAAAIPYSVSHLGNYWMLTSNLADVTAKTPGTDAEWSLILVGGSTGLSDLGTAKVTVTGGANETLVSIKANATQTAPMVLIKNSADDEMFRIHSDYPTNLFFGSSAGLSNTPLAQTTGRQNTFIGSGAGPNNTTGYASTYLGYSAGYSNITGVRNTFLGYQSGYQNVSGDNNTCVGVDAGATNTADNNIFIGYHCGFGFSNQITGTQNILIGNEMAVESGTSMHDNTNIGFQAGYGLTTAYDNSVFGSLAGFSLVGGYRNTLIGKEAGKTMVSAAENTLVGYRSGYFATGSGNTGIGMYSFYALLGGGSNVALGYTAGGKITTGGTNTFVGFAAGNGATQKIDATNSMALGNATDTTASNQVVIGNTAITQTLLRVPTVQSTVAGSGGGYKRTVVDVASAALSGSSGSIAVNVPSGARILGVQLRVDTAITSGDGGTTWTAVYVNTPTTAICSGQAFTKNTKYSAIHPAYEITTGTATITITPNSGTFSAGVVRAIVYYEALDAMSDAP